MARKRFIKLLMGLGLSRNEAAACSVTARERYGCYIDGACAYVAELLKACKEYAAEIMPLIRQQLNEMGGIQNVIIQENHK